MLAVAVLLGLRHATDPDHLAAVTTLVARAARASDADGGRARAGVGRRARAHAVRLRPADRALRRVLPERGAAGAETAIGDRDRRPRRAASRPLAARPLPRRTGAHSTHAARGRTAAPLGAFGIGLVHGIGGSAGVGVLIVATLRVERAVRSRRARVARRLHRASRWRSSRPASALTLVSGSVQAAFGESRRRSALRASPSASGTALGALSLAPYYF